MLKKCLKYDFRAVMRLWWILAVAMAGAAIIAGLGIRFFTQTVSTDNAPGALVVLSSLGLVGSILCVFAMIAGTTVAFILIFWRMYTHFYTDEGYLTFTLPVKRSTQYLSKVIMGTVVQAATVLILILGIAFILLVAPPTTEGVLDNFIFTELIGGITAAMGDMAGWLALWIPLALVIAVLAGLFGNGLVYLCITIGSVVAKKHKLLAAIGIYYLVNSVLSFASQIIFMFLSVGIVGIFDTAFSAGGLIAELTVTVVMLIICLVLACLAAVLHFVTVGQIEKKLNLA